MLRNSQVHHVIFTFSSLTNEKPQSRWSHVTPHIDSDPCASLAGITPPVDFEEEVTHDPNGETLTLEAKMQPLLLESMTKSKDGFLGVRRDQTAVGLLFSLLRSAD